MSEAFALRCTSWGLYAMLSGVCVRVRVRVRASLIRGAPEDVMYMVPSLLSNSCVSEHSVAVALLWSVVLSVPFCPFEERLIFQTPSRLCNLMHCLVASRRFMKL